MSFTKLESILTGRSSKGRTITVKVAGKKFDVFPGCIEQWVPGFFAMYKPKHNLVNTLLARKKRVEITDVTIKSFG